METGHEMVMCNQSWSEGTIYDYDSRTDRYEAGCWSAIYSSLHNSSPSVARPQSSTFGSAERPPVLRLVYPSRSHRSQHAAIVHRLHYTSCAVLSDPASTTYVNPYSTQTFPYRAAKSASMKVGLLLTVITLNTANCRHRTVDNGAGTLFATRFQTN